MGDWCRTNVDALGALREHEFKLCDCLVDVGEVDERHGEQAVVVWDDPYSFGVDRPDNGHLAFGHGAHVCLGHLARMELRLFWEELLPHVKSLELDGEATIHPANFINDPNFIPLVFETA